MQFFGVVFLVTTTLVLVFKKENSIAAEAELRKTRKSKRKSKHLKIDEENLNLRETYTILLKIFKLPAVIKFAFILVTCRVI